MTGAIEELGGTVALPCRIVELRTVAEGVDRDALSVDLRDPQRRICCSSIRLAECLITAGKWNPDLGHARAAGLENGIRFEGFRDEIQSGRGRCGTNHEGRY